MSQLEMHTIENIRELCKYIMEHEEQHFIETMEEHVSGEDLEVFVPEEQRAVVEERYTRMLPTTQILSKDLLIDLDDSLVSHVYWDAYKILEDIKNA